MLIVLTGILIMPFHTYAVSKKALSAYANFLRKYESAFEVEECDWDKENDENYKYSKEFAATSAGVIYRSITNCVVYPKKFPIN